MLPPAVKRACNLRPFFEPARAPLQHALSLRSSKKDLEVITAQASASSDPLFGVALCLRVVFDGLPI